MLKIGLNKSQFRLILIEKAIPQDGFFYYRRTTITQIIRTNFQ